jgi:hypothetical protein
MKVFRSKEQQIHENSQRNPIGFNCYFKERIFFSLADGGLLTL